MRKRITWLVLLAIFASPAGGAAAQEVSAYDRFQLFNECRPMDLRVLDSPSGGAAEIDLTEAAIQAAVESRLRSARLYDADAGPALYVNVTVVGRAFSLVLTYMKIVYDPASDDTLRAMTWIKNVVGTHGGDATYILSNVASYMDVFLVEYLRVNESACD